MRSFQMFQFVKNQIFYKSHTDHIYILDLILNFFNIIKLILVIYFSLKNLLIK